MKDTQPTKTPAMRAVHLEEEGSDEEAGAESENPDGLYSMMEKYHTPC